MSDVKDLTVTLTTDAEAAALTGGKKPRRPRSTRKQRGGAVPAGEVADGTGGALSPQEAAAAEGSNTRVLKLDTSSSVTPPIGTMEPVSGEERGAPILTAPKAMSGGGVNTEPISPLAVASSITPPAVIMPSLSATTVASGGGGAGVPAEVKIGGKRGIFTVNTVGCAKIIPIKRRVSGAPPAQTLKKPKFKVGGGENAEGAPPSAGAALDTPDKTGGALTAAKQTRRFKERKIKLTVKSSRVTREMRHKVKAQVLAMPLGDIRKLLLKKNIIKQSAAEKLPEEMLRNMLRDYMMLHNVD